MPDSPLRILITCRELAVRAGTQLYTRDLAEELCRRGHSPVVFSPRPGEVAAEIRSQGIAVIDRLDQLGELPDVIHGQHHVEAMQAMLRFPGVPALYVCHGWLPWQEAPPRFPSLTRYVAVDALRRDHLVLEHGIPSRQVTTIHNFVDLDRFRPRPPLPARPRRALLLSNQAQHTFVSEVERACAARGIELAVAGFASGRSIRPEEVLASYDLVLARGRAALEAMAVGCAVVLCDLEGSGPLVDSDNFAALRDLNFGVGALRAPVEAARLGTAIDGYDPAEAARVRDRVRREAGRAEAVERLIGQYGELLAAAPALQGEAYAQACLQAASRYVGGLGARTENAEDRLARAAGELTAAGHQLAEANAALQSLERSPFLRLRASLLGLAPLVSLYRAVKTWRA